MAEGMFEWVNEDPELAKLALTLYQIAPQIKQLAAFMKTAREAGRTRIKSLLELDERFKSMKPKKIDSIITALHSHMYGSFFLPYSNRRVKEYRSNPR